MGKMRVFIVDDSTVFRSQIRAALDGQPDIEVVGFAADGRMACEALRTKKADLVTLDLEMPVMGGLETLKVLRPEHPDLRVLVFSSQTKSGAEATLAALQLGASDFLCKPKLDPSAGLTPAEAIRSVLLPKIDQFRAKNAATQTSAPAPVVKAPTPSSSNFNWTAFNPEIVVIASSTGGPAALEKLFSMLKPPLRRPMLIAQHMPPLFTAALAERLGRLSGLPVVEAVSGTPLVSGTVYIAPGDYHMKLSNTIGSTTIVLDQGPLRNSVRPCANFLFESTADIYKNSVFGIVLTGMGEDGKDGALAVKRHGGGIFIQDKESCVVFGMPGAVHQEKAFDKMGPIETLAATLNDLAICGVREPAAKAG